MRCSEDAIRNRTYSIPRYGTPFNQHPTSSNLFLLNTQRKGVPSAETEVYTRAVTMAAAADIPLLVRSENSSSERRVSPAWTIAHLKARLEPITGVPASCQKLSLKVASQSPQSIEAQDEDGTQIGAWPLQAYAELQVGGYHPACFILSYIASSNSILVPSPPYFLRFLRLRGNGCLRYLNMNQWHCLFVADCKKWQVGLAGS